MEESDFNFNISVIGLGLMGGSLAKALRCLNPKRVYGVDICEDTVKKALHMGIIDEGDISGKSLLMDSDIVIIALYPDDAVRFVKDNIEHFKAGAVVTDICGLKQKIIEELIDVIPDSIEFVGGHPMAGKETCGIEAASGDIFIDTSYIITPHRNNTEKCLSLIERMAKGIGCKNVVRVDIEEHDRIITFTSQLPHVIAVALMNTRMCMDISAPFVGGSFRDATRVAAINTNLWQQLFTLNSERLIEEIERFEETLSGIKEAIKSHDKENLNKVFLRANEKRRKML